MINQSLGNAWHISFISFFSKKKLKYGNVNYVFEHNLIDFKKRGFDCYIEDLDHEQYKNIIFDAVNEYNIWFDEDLIIQVDDSTIARNISACLYEGSYYNLIVFLYFVKCWDIEVLFLRLLNVINRAIVEHLLEQPYIFFYHFLFQNKDESNVREFYKEKFNSNIFKLYKLVNEYYEISNIYDNLSSLVILNKLDSQSLTFFNESDKLLEKMKTFFDNSINYHRISMYNIDCLISVYNKMNVSSRYKNMVDIKILFNSFILECAKNTNFGLYDFERDDINEFEIFEDSYRNTFMDSIYDFIDKNSIEGIELRLVTSRTNKINELQLIDYLYLIINSYFDMSQNSKEKIYKKILPYISLKSGDSNLFCKTELDKLSYIFLNQINGFEKILDNLPFVKNEINSALKDFKIIGFKNLNPMELSSLFILFNYFTLKILCDNIYALPINFDDLLNIPHFDYEFEILYNEIPHEIKRIIEKLNSKMKFFEEENHNKKISRGMEEHIIDRFFYDGLKKLEIEYLKFKLQSIYRTMGDNFQYRNDTSRVVS